MVSSTKMPDPGRRLRGEDPVAPSSSTITPSFGRGSAPAFGATGTTFATTMPSAPAFGGTGTAFATRMPSAPAFGATGTTFATTMPAAPAFGATGTTSAPTAPSAPAFGAFASNFANTVPPPATALSTPAFNATVTTFAPTAPSAPAFGAITPSFAAIAPSALAFGTTASTCATTAPLAPAFGATVTNFAPTAPTAPTFDTISPTFNTTAPTAPVFGTTVPTFGPTAQAPVLGTIASTFANTVPPAPAFGTTAPSIPVFGTKVPIIGTTVPSAPAIGTTVPTFDTSAAVYVASSAHPGRRTLVPRRRVLRSLREYQRQNNAGNTGQFAFGPPITSKFSETAAGGPLGTTSTTTAAFGTKTTTTGALGTTTTTTVTLGTTTTTRGALGSTIKTRVTLGSKTTTAEVLDITTTPGGAVGSTTNTRLTFATNTNVPEALGIKTTTAGTLGTKTNTRVTLGTTTTTAGALGTITNTRVTLGTETTTAGTPGSTKNTRVTLGTKTTVTGALGTKTTTAGTPGSTANTRGTLGTNITTAGALGTTTTATTAGALGTTTNGRVTLGTVTTTAEALGTTTTTAGIPGSTTNTRVTLGTKTTMTGALGTKAKSPGKSVQQLSDSFNRFCSLFGSDEATTSELSAVFASTTTRAGGVCGTTGATLRTTGTTAKITGTTTKTTGTTTKTTGATPKTTGTTFKTTGATSKTTGATPKTTGTTPGRTTGTTPVPGPSGASDASSSPDPPLRFHSVHSSNIWVSRRGAVALRVWSDTNPGVAFSARPVRVREKIRLRIVEESSNSRFGAFRFGISTVDPSTLPHPAPEHSPSYLWATTLNYPLKKNDILCYCVNSQGNMRFSINGQRKGVHGPQVDTGYPFWALVDPWGNCFGVQFNVVQCERFISEIRLLSVEDPMPQLRYSKPVVPLGLHGTKGSNVQFSSGVVGRVVTELSQGYVFSAAPMCPGQTIVIQILLVQPLPRRRFSGLSFGLTSCDPATLRPCDLPDFAEQLSSRPEYWVVRKHPASNLFRGAELAVTLTLDGALQESRNNLSPLTIIPVDPKLKVWAFVDLQGTIRKVRLLTSQTTETPEQSVRAGSEEPETLEEVEPSNGQPELAEIPQPNGPADRNSTNSECSICLDNPVNSVVYKCGHACMCYTCAVKQWVEEDSRCPICREPIRDVIRTFRC